MAQIDKDHRLRAEPQRTARRSRLWLKVSMLVLLIGALAALLSRLDLRHDMGRLDLSVLSGSATGNYQRIVEQLSLQARRQHGRLRVVSSQGSADNVRRLAEARTSCEIQVALAQDGAVWREPRPVLLGRLPKAESMFFVARNGDQLSEFAQLAGLRVGIGPEGSGSALIASAMLTLPEFRPLALSLSHHSLEQQLSLVQEGKLDLAVMVIDEDASLIANALLQQGLQIAGFRHTDVIARRLSQLHTGRIGAGQYDAVRLLPAEDKKVLRVETLVLGNGCASRSETMDLLTLLSVQFPDFIRHNRDTPNTTGLALHAAAHDFFEAEGPELADKYVPWLVDVMPPANWAYVVMGVSLLFNGMGLGHRFLLWRIDAGRVALEGQLGRVFGADTTIGELASSSPSSERSEVSARVIAELTRLSVRSRRYSLSLLVPMGEEMSYRYQEELIHQTLSSLREYQRRAASAS